MQIQPIEDFLNREKEVQTMAEAYVHNIQYSGDMSTYNPIPITASQMYGSGKTWLGYNFMWKLRDSMYKLKNRTNPSRKLPGCVDLDELMVKFSRALEILLSSVYPYPNKKSQHFI